MALDGSFTCATVAPGRYYLYGGWDHGERELGRIEAGKITVTNTDEAQDLGVLTVT